MPADLLHILRALVDAAFKTGGITDTAHADLHGKLDAHDQAAAEPEPEPEAPPAAPPAGPVQSEPFGTEEAGFGG